MLKSEQDTQSFGPAFLSSVGLRGRIVELKSEECFFPQGFPADCVYCLQEGRVKSRGFADRETGHHRATPSRRPVWRRSTGKGARAAQGDCRCRVQMHRKLKSNAMRCFVSCISSRNSPTSSCPICWPQHAYPRRSGGSHVQFRRKAAGPCAVLMADTGKRGEPRTMIPPITQETLRR